MKFEEFNNSFQLPLKCIPSLEESNLSEKLNLMGWLFDLICMILGVYGSI